MIAVVVAALTAAVFAAVADSGALVHVQRLDDSWLRLMVSGRNTPATAVAKVFNVLGLVYVTLPVRVAVGGYLGYRRRWWRLAAFGAAVLLSEILIGPVKAAYDLLAARGARVAVVAPAVAVGIRISAAPCRGRVGT